MAGGSFFHIRRLSLSPPSSLIPHNPCPSNAVVTLEAFPHCRCSMPTLSVWPIAHDQPQIFGERNKAPEKTKEPSSGNSTASCRIMFLLNQCKDNVTNWVLVVNKRVCSFCLFPWPGEEKMETFAPKGKICGPILPQFILKKSITLGAKVMYALLCNYASENDHCWPSHATLAARLSCSVSSVKNYLTELVREKLISILRGRYRSSVYYLLCPEEYIDTQNTKNDSEQLKYGYREVKYDSINNLSKQNKERKSPLPPVASEQPQSSSASRPPAAGGVSSPVQDFESVWNLYPKKEAKEFARSAWFKLLRGGQLPPLDEIRAALQRFTASESWQREQGRFVPQMGNWLRGQRWLDPLPPAEQSEQRHDLELLRAMQAREEQERRIEEQQKAEKARLRPLFDAFAANFPPLANDAMAFGIWLHLHSLNLAPSASDIPSANALGIVEFMNDFKRKAQTAAYRETHGIPQAVRHETRTSECRPLGELLKTLPSVARFFQAGNRASGWPLESPVTACA